MNYPPPSYALQIWLGPNGVNVAIPPSQPGGKGHTITLDADAEGIKTILFFLRQRKDNPQGKLGSPGVPTQQLAEALQSSIRNATNIKITTVVKETYKEAKPGRLVGKRSEKLCLEDLGL